MVAIHENFSRLQVVKKETHEEEMGNFFSKESSFGGNSSTSGKVPASSSSSSRTKSTEGTNDPSHMSFELDTVASKSKSVAGTANKSRLSFEIDSVASKSKSGLSQSVSVSQVKMEKPVPVTSKPEKMNKSYIMSKMPKLEAQIYVPKTGEYYEFNSYELGGSFSVLVFYSGNFCSGVLPELHELKSVSRKTIKDYNLLAISTDTKESHRAFSHLGPEVGGLKNLNFVLVSDHIGEWSKTFQVYDESSHRAFPSYIILSADMRILYKATFDHNVGGNPNHIIEILNYLMDDKTVGEGVKDKTDSISRDSSHVRVSSDSSISMKSEASPVSSKLASETASSTSKKGSTSSGASKLASGTTSSTSTKSETSSGASKLAPETFSSTSTKSVTSSEARKLASGTSSSTSKKSATSSGTSKEAPGTFSSTSTKSAKSSGASKQGSGTDSSISKKSDQSLQNNNEKDAKNFPKEPVPIMPAKKDNSSAF